MIVWVQRLWLWLDPGFFRFYDLWLWLDPGFFSFYNLWLWLNPGFFRFYNFWLWLNPGFFYICLLDHTNNHAPPFASLSNAFRRRGRYLLDLSAGRRRTRSQIRQILLLESKPSLAWHYLPDWFGWTLQLAGWHWRKTTCACSAIACTV
jgi:hypothetical protein